MTSEEVVGAGGSEEPEGRADLLRPAHERFFAKASHCTKDQSLHTSHVKSLVHTLPLHLVQVGWGSLSREDNNESHFRPPTPGHTRHFLDIAS